ncbi:hypothetical protein F5X98DRAFT_350819 [Xylaria grammica]|nr:hypothetical protein F5X98DRAFT_350819 [Xylaria grammica]
MEICVVLAIFTLVFPHFVSKKEKQTRRNFFFLRTKPTPQKPTRTLPYPCFLIFTPPCSMSIIPISTSFPLYGSVPTVVILLLILHV